jgi:hypothetical protein
MGQVSNASVASTSEGSMNAKVAMISDKQQEAINEHFPGAMSGEELGKHVIQKLDTLGFSGENTLFTHSLCPDEINHTMSAENPSAEFMLKYGKTFPLGGLGGLPFTGKTGWHAFSSHCPDDGHIVVLFAPHVGIDADGKIGGINREGQACGSSACGAAIGAYGAAKNATSPETFQSGYSDHQMDCIKHLVAPHVEAIKSSKNEMATLAYKMFEIQEEFLEAILHSKWMGPNSKLSLIGGI